MSEPDVGDLPALQDLDALGMLFETSPMAMWVYDVETLRILRANSTAQRIYGWDAEEFTRLTIIDLRPAEDVDRLMNVTRLAARNDTSSFLAGLWIHRLRDGSERQVDITSQGLLVGDRPARLVVVRDESARVAAEVERDRTMHELVEVQEHLRSSIATRLHDGPVQTLTAASLRLGLARRVADPALQGQLAEAERLVIDALAALRQEMNEHRAPTEISPHLAGAVESLLGWLGLEQHYVVECSGDEPPGSIGALLYRVAQDLLATAQRDPVPAERRRIEIGVTRFGAHITVPVSAGVTLGDRSSAWTLAMDGTVERIGGDEAGSIIVTVPVPW